MRHPLLTTSATLAALLAGMLAVTACKDNKPSVPMVKAPEGVTGPTTAEVLAHNDDTPKPADTSEFEAIEPLGPAVAAKGPDGTIWQKYPSGLFIEDLKPGTGNYPKIGQTVHVKYVGTFPADGKVFDQSPPEKPFEFVLGKVRGQGTVIKGWQLALSNMRIGGKRKILVPPNLAYGEKGFLPLIRPNQPLIFDLELVAITGDAVELPPPSTQTGIPEIDKPQPVGPTTAP